MEVCGRDHAERSRRPFTFHFPAVGSFFPIQTSILFDVFFFFSLAIFFNLKNRKSFLPKRGWWRLARKFENKSRRYVYITMKHLQSFEGKEINSNNNIRMEVYVCFVSHIVAMPLLLFSKPT